MTYKPFREGDSVWFQPQSIGFGYSYGPDIGIPAQVVRVLSRVCIQFRTKAGDLVLLRWVSANNLIPRASDAQSTSVDDAGSSIPKGVRDVPAR